MIGCVSRPIASAIWLRCVIVLSAPSISWKIAAYLHRSVRLVVELDMGRDSGWTSTEASTPMR